MKKLLTFVFALCLMVTALCMSAFAADPPAAGVVLRVSGLKSGDSKVVIKDHKNFKDGWNDAMSQAKNAKKNGYQRIIVDLYADWTAVGGEFSSDLVGGAGFAWDTILFPANTHVTLNMNGHTIDRAMTTWEYNGEVMCIDDNADVIINDGTITGGWSCNGAGGIHIQDGADVVLNNVNIEDNHVDDDDGAGIAMYNKATLTMNGGSISDNLSHSSTVIVYGGGVYIKNASAVFKGVTFENNQGYDYSTHGAAVYVHNGTMKMENCTVTGNGLAGSHIGGYTIVDISNNSKVTMTDTKFLNNGFAQETYVSRGTYRYTSVIRAVASNLTMNHCTFADNDQVYLIDAEAAILTATESDFTGNNSFAFFGNCANITKNTFTNCSFSYNNPMFGLDSTFFFNLNNPNLSFIDCDFGEATFNDSSRVTFINSNSDDETPPVENPVEETIPAETLTEEILPAETPVEETPPAETADVETIPAETTADENPPAGTILATGSVPMAVSLAVLAAAVAVVAAVLSSRKKSAGEKTDNGE